MKKLSTLKRNKSSVDLLSKIPMRMRITPLLLAGFLMQAHAEDVYSQSFPISIEMSNATVEEVLNEIEANSDYHFLYNSKLIDVDRRVSVSADAGNIQDVLHELFDGTEVVYKVVDKQIVLSHKSVNAEAVAAVSQTKMIKGQVVDKDGVPIIGANLHVEGSTTGTITDVDGNFSLEVKEGDVVIVSYIGYTEYALKVTGKSSYSITLKEDSKALDEVVVVGYGTQKKVNLSGAVSNISGKDLAKRPVVNPAAMLQGRIPGLRVNQSTGQPGAESVSFRIRGQGTFSSAGSDPLVLINGVEGNISSVNPNMIESVSVLKDAASASIYGSRAANGVILVTTKQGVDTGENKAHISYHGNIGFNTPTKMYDLITNSVEYMNLANLANTNSGTTPMYTDEIINAYKNANGSLEYPSFDWLGYVFNTSVVQNHNLSIAGNAGSLKKTTYNVSLNYVNQPGTMLGFKYKKYNVTVDLTSQITDNIKIGSYTSMQYGDMLQTRQGQEDAFLSAMSQAPTYRPWLPDDGTGVVKWANYAYPFEQHNKNQVAIVEDGAMVNKRDFDINTQMWIDVKLSKGLTWYTKGAVRLQSNKSTDWRGVDTPVYDYHTKKEVNILGKDKGLSLGDSRRLYTNLYTYLKWDYSYNQKHHFNVMAGYSLESEKYETLNAFRRYYNFELPTLDGGAKEDWSNSGNIQEWALMSFFGRINYNFNSKYLLEANIRYDGTSRISSENRWGIFPSFSGAWRISEEEFIKKLNLPWLDNIKIRASWGQLGNQNIGLYPYQAMLSHVQDYSFNNKDVTTAYHQTAYANRNIKWETTTITDVGADIALFGGLNFTFDWYNKITTNILRGAQVSGLLGLSAPTVNNGELQNKGVEVSINYANSIKKGFVEGLQYNVGVYFDRSRNELINFGAEEISGNSIRREGLPYNQYYMLECIGVFATQDEIDNAPKQFNDRTLPGDLRFNDTNKDGVVNNDDRIPMSGRFPDFEYGVTANLFWKGFDFSFVGQGVANKKYYITGWGIQPFLQGSAPTREYVDKMWKEDNPYNAEHPRLYWSDMGGSKNMRENSYFLQNASYFRVKNITIGYTLPTGIVEKIKASKIRIYFSGDNLLTFTKFPGLDPERGGDGRACQYPQNKIYSIGINVEL